MSDIFISHVEEDAAEALAIAEGLEEAGFATRCYELHSLPGPTYIRQVTTALDRCKAVVLIISPDALGSQQIEREIVFAHETGRPIIPLLKGITHTEWQNQQPDWRYPIGAATSVRIPAEGAPVLLPRLIGGLRVLGIEAAVRSDEPPSPGATSSLSEQTNPPASSTKGPVPARPSPETELPFVPQSTGSTVHSLGSV